ncbi:rho guanine nucleotide exchange factor 19 [Syngnathoides biaculeatus]|uniref:rho guanine nucleotide exchange factor 19 n=1 Tax=Syngnathoides biaculeatus TaxID=300417 RepID=UPI002ADE8C68|nr:rho guanine nucleotide exchange factor 19 [Syngnathoides biaculeatus]XP_061663731.1 rho guanine nucleotide exchange factor 19 [Syngnathoides biaculeatus]
MLPGYGVSPFPDFQPHHHTLHCRGDGPSMWIPSPGESAALISGPKDDEPLPRPCHHKHVAVCQQETLAFIDLQSPVNSKINWHNSSSEQQCGTYAPLLNTLKHSESELTDWAKSYLGADMDDEALTSNTHRSTRPDIESQSGCRMSSLEQTNGGAQSFTSVYHPDCVPSLPLPFPLSSLYTNLDSWDSQIPCSPSPPKGTVLQSFNSYQPQRRTSQVSLKEKSIRRKIQVYSSDSLSDDSLSSPVLDADFLSPETFVSLLEEDLSRQSSKETNTSLLSTDATLDLQNLRPDIPHLATERLQMFEDSLPGVREDRLYMSTMATEGNTISRSRQEEHERRRFSASELISRLQLSQRKNSFTLKLGKSLSARVASRDRQGSSSLSPDNKSNTKQHSSGGSSDNDPHSPAGPAPPLPSSDNGVPTHWWSAKLGMRKRSIEEDLFALPTVARSNRLSRFLPSSILYQEYSDVAINREIRRQRGKGTEEEGLRDDGSDGTMSPSSLSPSSSFCSSRGSAFALWQDIPDVHSSGQLDNFSNEQRKLQEAKFELVTSEASYIRSLTIAVDHFMLSQELSECLGAQDKQWLFSKLPEVKDVSERFLQDLEHRLEEDILHFDVCDIILKHCPALRRVYLPYVTNQAYQEQTYQRLLQDKARFPAALARLEEDSVCQRLPLTSFLILPFQRITRLKMLVENILKRTSPGSRDEDTATKAFNELKKIIKECNSSVQSMKRMEELIHLNKKIHFEGKIFPLISQSRWLVKHGELLEIDTQTMSISGSKFKLPTKPVYLHLFNDCLLLSRRKDTWKFLVFVHAKIGELKVKDLSQKLQGISGFIFHLQLCDGQQLKHQILLKSHTESGKQRWIAAMFPSNPLEDIEHASENDDISQVQCIRSYQAQEHDELTLEKADILHAKTITSDGWVEGIRLSDGEQGWFPKSYVEEITSRTARLRNLRENIRIKCVMQKLGED